MHNQTINTAMM